jgi:4-hydroxy-tetrahydrodipicolinate synthase
MMDFGRLITAMATPFDGERRLDLKKTEQLVEHLITEQQTDGIVVVGTTGESPTLTKEEKLSLIEKVVEVSNGRCKVIAGTGSNDTVSSIAMSKKVEEIGVDGLLLVNPYYNRPSQEGLYQHFRSIAESTNLPVMLYNIPSRTAVNMTAETTIRLSKVDNIVAMKESSGDLAQVSKIISGTDDNFRVYSGDDYLLLPILAVGGHGVVSVASHLIGKQIKQMIQAFDQGDHRTSTRLHLELLPLMEALFIAPNPVPLKALLSMKGFDLGGVRLPLVAATEEQKTILKQWA